MKIVFTKKNQIRMKIQIDQYSFCNSGKEFVANHIRECDNCRNGLITIVNDLLNEYPMLRTAMRFMIDGEDPAIWLKNFFDEHYPKTIKEREEDGKTN